MKEANFSFFHLNISAFRKEGFARLKGMGLTMNGNKVYITSAGVITGTKTNTKGKHFKIEPKYYEAFLEHFQTRNVDRISKISLAAAAMTLMRRNVLEPSFNIEKGENNDYGIFLGTQYSALESIHNYDMEALEKGALAVNPGLFPNTVLNSPACQVSIQCSFAGPVYTVCNGLTSSLDAIGLGYNFVRTGLSSMVLAGGVDEITELQAMMENNEKNLGEAGGFLMLESEKTVSKSQNEKLAEVIGYKSSALNKEQKESLAETVSALIIDAVNWGGNDFANVTNISLSTVFSCQESETILSDICKELNYSGDRKYMEIDWMGACGIVQADEVLKANGSSNSIWALVNIESEKATVVVLKTHNWPF